MPCVQVFFKHTRSNRVRIYSFVFFLSFTFVVCRWLREKKGNESRYFSISSRGLENNRVQLELVISASCFVCVLYREKQRDLIYKNTKATSLVLLLLLLPSLRAFHTWGRSTIISRTYHLGRILGAFACSCPPLALLLVRKELKLKPQRWRALAGVGN